MLEKLPNNRRLRHQHHCGEVSELSAHALLYPYFRAGDLWYRHGHLCPHSAAAYAADDGHGVELLPFFGQGRGGRGDVRAAKRRLFATTWGVTSLAAVVFFVLVASFRNGVAGLMGEAYAAHPEYVVWVGLIILFDVWACIPFSRLREQGAGRAVRRTSAERGGERSAGRRFRRLPGFSLRNSASVGSSSPT